MEPRRKSMEYHRVDIAIVGAGLVGASLAALLANAQEMKSLSVILIDQGKAPTVPDLSASVPVFDPRVVALSPNSIALMQSLGVWPKVETQRTCSYTHMTVWDDEGTGQIEFDARELHQPRLGAIVENSLLLNSLLEALNDRLHVNIFHRQGISQLLNGQSTKQLVLNNGAVVEASLVIAADGAHSKIRELVNLPLRSWSYQHKAIVATIKCEHEHQHTAWQNFLTTGPLAFLPLGDESNRYFSIVWSAETKQADDLMALTDNDFKVKLAKAMEHRFGEVLQLDQRYCFPLVQRHAINYFVPQVALVGDAAHTIHPLAGQGVNLGFKDAQAIAIELKRACERKLPLTDVSILRRYQRQRKRNNLEMMIIMESFKRLFGSRNLGVRWLRNTGFKAVDHYTPVKKWLARQAMSL